MMGKVREVPHPGRWHEWFAWRPVRVYAGSSTLHRWVWLETIWRKEEWVGGYDPSLVRHYRIMRDHACD